MKQWFQLLAAIAALICLSLVNAVVNQGSQPVYDILHVAFTLVMLYIAVSCVYSLRDRWKEVLTTLIAFALLAFCLRQLPFVFDHSARATPSAVQRMEEADRKAEVDFQARLRAQRDTALQQQSKQVSPSNANQR